MNALAPVVAAGAIPFSRATFTVWAASDGAITAAKHLIPGATLREVEDRIADLFDNKSTVMVLEADDIARSQMLHTYRVRVGKPVWRVGYADKVAPKRAERICSLRVAAFEPVEPWRWTPGCDVVGHGDDVVVA